MMTLVKKVKLLQKNWRPTVEDLKLLAEIKTKLGMVNETDILRLALRALASKEGVSQ